MYLRFTVVVVVVVVLVIFNGPRNPAVAMETSLPILAPINLKISQAKKLHHVRMCERGRCAHTPFPPHVPVPPQQHRGVREHPDDM